MNVRRLNDKNKNKKKIKLSHKKIEEKKLN